MESIGSLIFLVMILAVSIDQGQSGNNGLLTSAIEETEPRRTVEIEAKEQVEDYQTSNNEGLMAEKIESASIQEWNKITSMVHGAVKYLEKYL